MPDDTAASIPAPRAEQGRVPPRLHVLLAREAPVGVVIRRGPGKQTQLILWDTDTDQFTAGQWMKARVYERRCDLTPDGTKLVYFALNGHFKGPTTGSYTAVSRPPYFTALALWPKGDAWNGGGLFVNVNTLWLNGGHHTPLVEPPARLRVTSQCPYPREGNAEDLGVYYPRLRRDGWTGGASVEEGVRTVRRWEKVGGGKRSPRLIKRAVATAAPREPGRGCYFDEHQIASDGGAPAEPMGGGLWVEWADFDRRGRLVYAAAGKLWELVRRVGHGGRDAFHSNEIADFNGATFHAILSPEWAKKW